jgi:succinate-semialdehyde dehydrogenase/glutarate-semialdehyde dehydrogenase
VDFDDATRHEEPMQTLNDPSLLRQQAYIGGAWVDAANGETIPVHNPATGELLGTVPHLGAADTRRAIEAARDAWPAWRAKTAHERAAILRAWHGLMLSHADDLAAIMTLEQGKPLSESKAEVTYAASFFEWFAEQAKRIEGDILESPSRDRRILVTKAPIGVCAAITPWNFPAAMITRKVAPALAAGCPIVLKPAELTPYSALALAVLAERAGAE